MYSTRLGIVLVVVSMVAVPAVLFGAQSQMARMAVLTPGLTLEPVPEGLEEGLTRLGYVKGKNITFMVEDTKGIDSDLPPRIAKLVAAKPDVLFTVSHQLRTGGEARNVYGPDCFRLGG